MPGPLLLYPSRLVRIDPFNLLKLSQPPKQPAKKPPHSERLWTRRKIWGFCKIKVTVEPEGCSGRVDGHQPWPLALFDDHDPRTIYEMIYDYCDRESVLPLQAEMRALAGTPSRRIRKARRAQTAFWERFISWAWDAA